MRATEFITELFDNKPFNWEFRGSEEAFATFKVGEQEFLWSATVMNAQHPNTWTLAFKQRDHDDYQKSFGRTGTGNEFTVIPTVVAITKEFLEQYGNKVLELRFSSDDEGGTSGRTSAYTKMVKRLLPDWNMHTKKEAGETDFYLTNPEAYENVDEMALKQFTPMGNFEKPGPFKGVDKRLVPHPTNQLKTAKFFEQTPYDFRLFFSNIPGTSKYNETGPVTPQQLEQMFGQEYAKQILDGSEDAITVVFVGNSGDSKVMMTPWIMAHRFGHAIQAGARRNRNWHIWTEAEKHFFNAVNNTLEEYYGKQAQKGFGTSAPMKMDLTPEYNALFNAIGTQRSSRSGQIKRPYEFLYEIFAQYLGTGQITFNPLPSNLGYGRKNWGNPSKYLNLKPEMRDDAADAAQTLANDMQYMFDDVLSSSVGQIFVM